MIQVPKRRGTGIIAPAVVCAAACRRLGRDIDPACARHAGSSQVELGIIRDREGDCWLGLSNWQYILAL